MSKCRHDRIRDDVRDTVNRVGLPTTSEEMIQLIGLIGARTTEIARAIGCLHDSVEIMIWKSSNGKRYRCVGVVLMAQLRLFLNGDSKIPECIPILVRVHDSHYSERKVTVCSNADVMDVIEKLRLIDDSITALRVDLVLLHPATLWYEVISTFGNKIPRCLTDESGRDGLIAYYDYMQSNQPSHLCSIL